MKAAEGERQAWCWCQRCVAEPLLFQASSKLVGWGSL